MEGKLEVVKTGMKPRDMRLIMTAIRGYATRVFSNKTSGLVAAVRSRKRSQEEQSKLDLFLSGLHEFLRKHISTDGFNVVLGGRIGFSIRTQTQACAVLRLGGKNNEESASAACLLLIYKVPSAAPEESALSKLQALKENASGGSQELQIGSPSCKNGDGMESNDVAVKRCEQAQGDKETRPGAKNNRQSVEVRITAFSSVKLDEAASKTASLCAKAIRVKGFIDLPLSEQKANLELVLQHSAVNFQSTDFDVQKAAESVRDSLMDLSGPWWSVFIGEGEIHVKTGKRLFELLISFACFIDDCFN